MSKLPVSSIRVSPHRQARLAVVEIRADHHRPFQAFGAVVGEHVDGVAAGHHRLQIQTRGSRLLQPEQKSGQRSGIVVDGGVLFVLLGQVEEGVEILLSLRGTDVVRPPGSDDAADVRFVQHPGDDLHR